MKGGDKYMRLWKVFLIVGVILSAIGSVLLPVSQITEIEGGVLYREALERVERIYIIRQAERDHYIISPYGIYPHSWLMLPATVILAIGIVSIIYSYLVKRAYG